MAAQPDDRTDVLGRRIGAALLDLGFVFVLFLILALLIGTSETGDGGARVALDGAPALLWIALSLLYYFATEAISGQTFGKRTLGVRVAGADGADASAGQIAVRTALRLIDGFGFYLVGLVSVLATGERRQRLGDLAARTTVTRA